MAFLPDPKPLGPTPLKGLSIDFLHRHGCTVCPLSKQAGLKHPDMQPTGSKQPLVYILAEAPGGEEDKTGVQLVGPAGKVLRFRIPERWLPKIRWNNCVRTRPPDNREPTPVEIECCRPSIVADIEATKPKAIFGFGNIPLLWALKQSGITKWNGRRVPIQVGSHKCWYFPMLHPSYILHAGRKFTPTKQTEYGSDLEFVFAFDLKRAFESIETLPEPVIHTEEQLRSKVEWVTGHKASDEQRVNDALRDAHNCKVVGFDYETNGIRPYKKGSKILTVAIATDECAFAFPLDHKQAGWSENARQRIDLQFRRWLFKAPCRKVVHQLAFEMEWTAVFFGRKALRAGRWGDSVSQAYVLDERLGQKKPGCHSLEFLYIQYFGFNIKALSDVDQSKLDDEPLEKVLSYNALDSLGHRNLYIAQTKRLKEDKLASVYNHQLRRIPTVVLTQYKGVPVDQERNDFFFKRYNKRLAKIEGEVKQLDVIKRFEKLRRQDFAFTNNFDLKFVVNKMLKIETEGIDEKALNQVNHPIAKLMIRWRKANRLLNWYVMPYRVGSPHLYDGKLHPVISATKTRTGRTSSEDPNIQNVPKRGPGKEVRRQIRHASRRIVAFDYAGIQARNVAMESKDEALVKAFWNKYDIHTDWLEKLCKLHPPFIDEGYKAICGKDDESVTLRKAYRDRVKNEFVFPSFFGAIPKSIAGYLGVPEEIGIEMQEEFWDRFPGVKTWHKRTVASYYRQGYVTGLSEYRRHAPIAVNEIINSPIQADESKIVLGAMSRLSEMDDLRFQANLEIHDDLAFCWEPQEIDRNAEVVINEMIKCVYPWINVPLVVEMSIGDDWFSLKSAGEFSSDGWPGIDPNGGSWADGTGWANHEGYEKSGARKRSQ